MKQLYNSSMVIEPAECMCGSKLFNESVKGCVCVCVCKLKGLWPNTHLTD